MRRTKEEGISEENRKRTGLRCGRSLWAVSLAVLMLLAGCAQKDGAWEEERTPVAALGDETIYLDEALFYTRMLQEQWELAYYESLGSGMWQQESEEGGKTLEQLLKEDVMSMLTEIHLLGAHAKEYGIALTEEEKQEITVRAAGFMESNTPAVLEAAGATEESVELYLTHNELAAKTAEKIKSSCEPVIDEEEAAVGKLTYCLFSTTGTYDADGNYTSFTEEEREAIRVQAEAFAARARELEDITAAGEEVSRTVIDVYFSEQSSGGAHEQVADEARGLEEGGVSGLIETEDGYYIVQKISDYDESATRENMESLEEQAREDYLLELEAAWEAETPLTVDEEVWGAIVIDGVISEG